MDNAADVCGPTLLGAIYFRAVLGKSCIDCQRPSNNVPEHLSAFLFSAFPGVSESAYPDVGTTLKDKGGKNQYFASDHVFKV